VTGCNLGLDSMGRPFRGEASAWSRFDQSVSAVIYSITQLKKLLLTAIFGYIIITAAKFFQQYASAVFWGQQPLAPLLLLGPPFLLIILFGSTTLIAGMTGFSLHMQLLLISHSHGSKKTLLSTIFVHT
jgi:hypothetical protein